MGRASPNSGRGPHSGRMKPETRIEFLGARAAMIATVGAALALPIPGQHGSPRNSAAWGPKSPGLRPACWHPAP